MMNYENIYNNLKEYMFYPDVIKRNMSEVCQSTGQHVKAEHHIKNNFSNTNNELVKSKYKSEKEKEKEKEQDAPFFIPSEKDKFFWGFYIFLHGEYEYKIAKNNWFSIEKQLKMYRRKESENRSPLAELAALEALPDPKLDVRSHVDDPYI